MQSLNDKYISIQGWMVEELKLKGNDLLVYAIIYGFSQDNESEFTGSLSYLARWCNSTKNGIQKNLKKLIDAKLISKKSTIKNGVKYCSYSCTSYNRVVQGIQQSYMGVYNRVVIIIQIKTIEIKLQKIIQIRKILKRNLKLILKLNLQKRNVQNMIQKMKLQNF